MYNRIKPIYERFINSMLEEFNPTGYKVVAECKRYSFDLIVTYNDTNYRFNLDDSKLYRMLTDIEYMEHIILCLIKELKDYYEGRF